MNVVKCGTEDCFKCARYDTHRLGEGDFFRQHAAEEMPRVSDTAPVSQSEHISNHGQTEDGAGKITDAPARKRMQHTRVDSGVAGDVAFNQIMHSSPTRVCTTSSLVSAQLAGTDKVCVEAWADMKLEMRVEPSVCNGSGVRRRDELSAHFSHVRDVGGLSKSGNAKRVYAMTTVILGRLVAMNEVVSGEAVAQVKMELSVTSSSFLIEHLTNV